ncbi:MAG: riboflavin synthase [Patescibacteria group bacterium]
MFTGIVQELGTITKIQKEDWVYYTIASPSLTSDIKIGSSVAVDGICLTVLSFNDSEFTVQVMPETVAKTNLVSKQIDSRVNLELSLKIGDTLDGHFVMGHVDGVGKVNQLIADGDFWVLSIIPPVDLLKFIALKGSIAINGTSLTISAVGIDKFEVSLIQHTLENTNLKGLTAGEQVNLEADVFARYVDTNLKYKIN